MEEEFPEFAKVFFSPNSSPCGTGSHFSQQEGSCLPNLRLNSKAEKGVSGGTEASWQSCGSVRKQEEREREAGF